jgi:hypothetical protein
MHCVNFFIVLMSLTASFMSVLELTRCIIGYGDVRAIILHFVIILVSYLAIRQTAKKI